MSETLSRPLNEPLGRPAAAGASLLDQAKQGRAQIVRQVAQIQAARPARGAGPAAQARWLRDMAAVHDRVAGQLRDLGDIPGAVQAEVTASRCRIDARDLSAATAAAAAAESGEQVAGLDGPCCLPVLPAAAVPPASAATCRGVTAVPAEGIVRDRSPAGAVREQDEVLVTCGPGLP